MGRESKWGTTVFLLLLMFASMCSGARSPVDFGGSDISVGYSYNEKKSGLLKISIITWNIITSTFRGFLQNADLDNKGTC